MTRGRKILIGVGAVVLLGALGLFLYGRSLSNPMPSNGVAGPEADALAHELEVLVNKPAWERTGAVEWDLGPSRKSLWDRTRGYYRFDDGNVVTLIDLNTRKGRAFEGKEELSGSALEKRVKKAWEVWANDSFWLNPLVKLFDDGVTRKKVDLPGGEIGLLISYASGGVTPGDSYLWIIPRKGELPRAWRTYVQILPIPGLEFGWDGWVTLATGAKISTKHTVAGKEIKATTVRGAATLAELTGGKDPFLSPE